MKLTGTKTIKALNLPLLITPHRIVHKVKNLLITLPGEIPSENLTHPTLTRTPKTLRIHNPSSLLIRARVKNKGILSINVPLPS
jgi:hypothetical protein